MQKWDKFLLLLTVDRYRYEYVSDFIHQIMFQVRKNISVQNSHHSVFKSGLSMQKTYASNYQAPSLCEIIIHKINSKSSGGKTFTFITSKVLPYWTHPSVRVVRFRNDTLLPLSLGSLPIFGIKEMIAEKKQQCTENIHHTEPV